MPELELREATNERTELVIVLGGKAAASIAVLQALILREGGVEARREEGEEEVQEVDTEGVCDCGRLDFNQYSGYPNCRVVSMRPKRTDVPSLREDNAQEENEQQHSGTSPPISRVGR